MTSLYNFFCQTSSYFRTLKGNIFLGACIYWSEKFWTPMMYRYWKMDSFAKISGNLQNFGTLFPLWTLPECICSTVFDPLVDCRMHSCNYIKRKLHYIHFSGTFPKFSAQLFQISLMESSVAEFSTVLGGRL